MWCEQGKTYEETLLDVADYAKSAGIPYRHILLDSWWCKWQPLSFRLSLFSSRLSEQLSFFFFPTF